METRVAENGTDETAIVGKFQLNNQYKNLTSGQSRNDLVPRLDYPLTPSVLFRVDMPFRWADPNLRSGATFVGTSDMLVRLGKRLAYAPEYRLFAGSDFIFPTASNNYLGQGKYQVAPIVGGSLAIPEIKSVLLSYVEYYKSVGGYPSRKDIAQTKVRAELTIPTWFEHWWTKFEPELRVDGKRHSKTGMLVECEVGRRFGDHWRIYAEPGVGLWGDSVTGNYDWKVEVGVRYMLYVF